MHDFTILMVLILLAIYLASCVLKRKSLVYLTLISGVGQAASTLMDDTLSNNELTVLALIPLTITMLGSLTLMYGEERQW